MFFMKLIIIIAKVFKYIFYTFLKLLINFVSLEKIGKSGDVS
jgi:hypothetical protein